VNREALGANQEEKGRGKRRESIYTTSKTQHFANNVEFAGTGTYLFIYLIIYLIKFQITLHCTRQSNEYGITLKQQYEILWNKLPHISRFTLIGRELLF